MSNLLNLLSRIPMDTLMNVYFYLSIKDLFNMISVSQASKISIQQKYDKLPISSNTIQEYTLSSYNPNNVRLYKTSEEYKTMYIPRNQLSLTLLRRVETIHVDVDFIHQYEPIWFQHIKHINLACQHNNDIIQQQRLNECLALSSATKVSWNLPWDKFDISTAIFPKNLTKLTLHNYYSYNDEQYLEKINNYLTSVVKNKQEQSFPQNLSDLIIIGNSSYDWLSSYLCTCILAPNLCLRSLSIKDSFIHHKSSKLVPCDLFQLNNIHDIWTWKDITDWSFYKLDALVIPKRMIINCRINIMAHIDIDDDLKIIFNGMKKVEHISPLQELHLCSYFVIQELCDQTFDGWVKSLSLIIKSNIFPQLTVITYELIVKYNGSNSSNNLPKQYIINGVSLTVTCIVSTCDDIHFWLDKRTCIV